VRSRRIAQEIRRPMPVRAFHRIAASPGSHATLMNLPPRSEPDDTVDDEDVVELLVVA
jgi:hypothetical protein